LEAVKDLIMFVNKSKVTEDETKPKKKLKVQDKDQKDSLDPYEVLTDALVSLCSTSMPSLRNWLGEIFELLCHLCHPTLAHYR